MSLFLAIAFALASIDAAEITPMEEGERSYDVVVAGATPGGLSVAIRCAREGMGVLVVSHTRHIGGMLSTGLGVLDTEYYRARSPILDEMCSRLKAHYGGSVFNPNTYVRDHVGERLYYEPHVIESILNEMVHNEKIDVLLGYFPKSIRKEGDTIRAVRFQRMGGDSTLLVAGDCFVDATYEGDLAALADIPYRVGRESKEEFNEPSAGVYFSYLVDTGERPDSIKDLRVHKFRLSSRLIPHPRNGEGDNAIQAYNFRPTLSNDPKNRYLPPKPESYDPEAYQLIKERLTPLPKGDNLRFPNKIVGWNTAILPGGNHDYPTASWPVRRKIENRHRDWLIGILYYLQRDLPEPVWGLAKDEFVDNDHMPYEMYVREARRIQGLEIFTELDGLLSDGFNRAPIHSGSIAITEWAIDSHACTTDRHMNSRLEGKVLLAEDTVPGQVDFRCLIAPDAKNLIVPVCLSSTHVGWGTIRLEPTWMHIGESVGYAIALSNQQNIGIQQLDINVLQRKLANKRVLLSYFDDVEVIQDDDFVPAIQYFGTKGFFSEYKARPKQALDAETAKVWIEVASAIRSGIDFDPNEFATQLAQVDSELSSQKLDFRTFMKIVSRKDRKLALKVKEKMSTNRFNGPISRGQGCQLLYEALSMDTAMTIP